MDISEALEKMEIDGFKKLTGPPEDWLKFYNTLTWGFREKPRLHAAWDKIKSGDIFIFHSIGIEYLFLNEKVQTGIIGFGIINKKEMVNDEVYDGGFDPPNIRPLKLYFSQIWLFGKYKEIINETIKEKRDKGDLYILEDIKKLVNNCITFEEMRNYNCVISTQGAIQNISKQKQPNLIKLINLHLESEQ